MNTLILQPPLMQLNTAYPSGAYLSGFFKMLGCRTAWLDLNIELFQKIFSAEGLEKIFERAEKNALAVAQKSERKGDFDTAFNLRRYLAQKNLWCAWIEKICQILRGKDFESAHRFAFGAHVPRGNRMETFLENADHPLTTDDCRTLASLALADLADFINVAYDSNFSLIRYAESLTISESSFEQIEKGAESPVMKDFFIPLVEEKVVPRVEEFLQDSGKLLVCVSIPFPGIFASALALGKFLKSRFKTAVYVSFGGGFVNTELRETEEPSLSEYCDCLCYDRGYASYKTLIERLESNSGENQIYNIIQFKKDGEACRIIKSAAPTAEDLAFEKKMTVSVIPDFSGIDFSKYPRLTDDTNPMHRLWSDGAWIKAYMAHGCYWHKCAFCDVTLDYVKSYCKTDIKKLYNGLLAQCKEKGIFGIHFVDEAMPPAAMIEFARENIAHGSPITWWGNIRFESIFSRDVADFLAYGGLTGVSAGLESATKNGLNAIHKGTDLQSVVGACCAFKEAGILVHAYMIYGYWWETPQDLLNSMETLRQFYQAGILDSSFWHKFVLTRHSRVFAEKQNGMHAELKITGQKNVPLFAKNGLHFEGEKNSEKYGFPLECALDEWMHGRNIQKPVQQWFDFPVPKPTVPKNFIGSLIQKYEEKRDREFRAELPQKKEKIFWLGGEKIRITRKAKNGADEEFFQWNFMGELYEEKTDAPQKNFRGKGLCVLP